MKTARIKPTRAILHVFLALVVVVGFIPSFGAYADVLTEDDAFEEESEEEEASEEELDIEAEEAAEEESSADDEIAIEADDGTAVEDEAAVEAEADDAATDESDESGENADADAEAAEEASPSDVTAGADDAAAEVSAEAAEAAEEPDVDADLSALATDEVDSAATIKYRAHVQDEGWQSWVSDGATAGTTGEYLRLEAVQIKLTGEMAEYYDMYYRVYVEGYGWLVWACNGEVAGSMGLSKRAEAIQAVIVAKGEDAPGDTETPYVNVSNTYTDEDDMLSKAQSYSSSTSYLVLVNTSANRLGIYQGSKGNWVEVKYWVCSTGKVSTPTPTGEYTVKAKGYSFGSGYTCYFYTQSYGNYLFHSVLYNEGTFTIQDGALGENVSHGCGRLELANAKWIYDNIPIGTKVVIYKE